MRGTAVRMDLLAKGSAVTNQMDGFRKRLECPNWEHMIHEILTW